MTFQFRDDVERMPKSDLLLYIDALEQYVEAHQADDAEQGLLNLSCAFGLTRQESLLLYKIADGRPHSRESLLAALYAGSAEPAEVKIVDVVVCRLRHKLAGSGVAIRTLWGIGYAVEDPAVLKAAMGGEPVSFDAGFEAPSIGKPFNGETVAYGSVRDAARTYLRSVADEEGYVRITSKVLSRAAGNRTPGNSIIRGLEDGGHLVVVRSPATRGAEWVLKLTEAGA